MKQIWHIARGILAKAFSVEELMMSHCEKIKMATLNLAGLWRQRRAVTAESGTQGYAQKWAFGVSQTEF